MIETIDLTNIFWPFVRTVVNTPYEVSFNMNIYKSLQKNNENKNKQYKIRSCILSGIQKINLLPSCITIIDDYMYFNDFNALFYGLRDIYNEQPNSEDKLLINRFIATMYDIYITRMLNKNKTDYVRCDDDFMDDESQNNLDNQSQNNLAIIEYIPKIEIKKEVILDLDDIFAKLSL